MPNPLQMLLASGVAGLVASVIVLVSAILVPRAVATWTRAGWNFGIGAGFLVGCSLLGRGPRGSFAEDVDRLLVIVMPTAVLVESVVSHPRFPGALAWLTRMFVAGSVAPLLLQGTVYLSDVGGPGTREWSVIQATFILVTLPIAIVAGWWTLSRIHGKPLGRLVEFLVLSTCVSAGIAVMLSGYLTGGQIALPLAGAFAGALFVSAFRFGSAADRPLGVVVVGLASVLLLGCCFGTLPLPVALLLYFAPLAAALTGLPSIRRLAVPWRIAATLVLYTALVGAVLWHVQRVYLADATPPASGMPETTVNDYLNFGHP